MVRLARTATLGIRPVRIRQASQGDKGTMKKKTAQPRRKQRKTSVSEKKKGLIAQKKTTRSSERAKYALDNRSHRTSCGVVSQPA
jgi:Ulp1 family protease